MLGDVADPLAVDGENPQARDLINIYLADEIGIEDLDRLLDELLKVGTCASSLDALFAHREAEEQRVSTEQDARNAMRRWVEMDITRTQTALQSQIADDGS
jgi:hypothetical protein